MACALRPQPRRFTSMPRTGTGRARPPKGRVGRARRIFQKNREGEAGSNEPRSSPSRRGTVGQTVGAGAARAKAIAEDKTTPPNRRRVKQNYCRNLGRAIALPSQQLRQLGDVRSDPSRFIARVLRGLFLNLQPASVSIPKHIAQIDNLIRRHRIAAGP